MYGTLAIHLYNIGLRTPRAPPRCLPNIGFRVPVLRWPYCDMWCVAVFHITPCLYSHSSVQGFFAFRIYTLSQKLYIPILCWTMSLMRLAAHTVMGIEAVRMTSWASYEAQWRPLLTTIWVVSATNDVIITTSLVFLLFRQRSYVHKRYLSRILGCVSISLPHFFRTVAVMDKIILWTVGMAWIYLHIIFTYSLV